MSSAIVRADHQQLLAITRVFEQHSTAVAIILKQLTASTDTLRAGDWVGQGANAFYAEIDSHVLPSLKRLARAMEEAARVSKQISAHMQQAEQDAAAYFITTANAGRPDTAPVSFGLPQPMLTIAGGGEALLPLSWARWLSVPATFAGFVSGFDISKFPAWLLSLFGFKPETPLISPLPDQTPTLPAEAPPLSTASPSEASPSATPTLTPATEASASATAATLPRASESISVPTRDQHGLKYKDGETQYGCVPTSASMIVEYWHQRNAANPTYSAQELLNKNAEQSEFSSTGMRIDQLGNDLGPSYTVNTVYDSNRTALEQAIQTGPVMAVVRLNLKTSGGAHAVVVTDIATDGTVSLNDPWTGKAQTYAWDTFDASWGASFGKGFAARSFTTVVPTTP